MAMIYQNRDIDYYIEPYDGEVTARALELIAQDQYDAIMVYNQEYDDMMHRTVPESEQAMAAFHHHIEAFRQLTDAVREHWSGHDSMVVWATDHGCHVDEVIGHGNHGTEEERDMNIMHYFGVYPRK